MCGHKQLLCFGVNSYIEVLFHIHFHSFPCKGLLSLFANAPKWQRLQTV